MFDQLERVELMRAARRAWSEASSLLFVCLGNICRSPFAEHLARKHLDTGKRLMSAGTYPVPGRGAPADAITAARPFGVDLSPHRSRVLSPQTLGQADAVFIFDPGNHRAVLSQQPDCAPRLHWLGALTDDGPLAISDPFGGPASEFELVSPPGLGSPDQTDSRFHGRRSTCLTLAGIRARVATKLLALAAGVWLNHQLGRPTRAFAALAV